MLEIIFRGFPRCSRPSRSKVRVLVSILWSPAGHPTPPELRDRSIWRQAARKPRISKVQKWVGSCWASWGHTQISKIWKVFIGYLEAEWPVAVHILQFRSTHQYYRTAKYDPNRTIGDEDNWYSIFGRPISRIHWARPVWPGHVRIVNGWKSAGLEHITGPIFTSSDPIRSILCSPTVLMSTCKL